MHARTVIAALLATVISLTSTASALAAPTLTKIDGLYGRKINDNQQVLGFLETNYGEGYQPMALWTKGTKAPLLGPVSSFNLNVDSALGPNGEVFGSAYDFGDLENLKKLGTFYSSPKDYRAFTVTGTEWVITNAGDLMSYDSAAKQIQRNGQLVDTIDGFPYFAKDGSYAVSGQASDKPSYWYSAIGATPINLGVGVTISSIASNGHMLASRFVKSGNSYSTVYLRIDVDKKAGTANATVVTFPTYLAVISGKGTIVYASSTDHGPTTVTKIALDGTTQDLTPVLGTVNDAAVLDINDWGDVILSTMTGSRSTGFKNTTYLIAGARTALTGQVQASTVASGRSKLRAKAPSLGGKTITVTDGSSTFTAVTNAKGVFRFDLPAGSGYVLSAPAGLCVLAGNGCFTSTPLAPIKDGSKAIALAKVQVPALGSFTQKAGASLRTSSGKVTLTVRCRASVNCKTTITLRKGTTVYGTAAATVNKGKTKSITVALNRAGKNALMKTATIPVGASLATKAGATKTTVALSVKLVRGT